MDLHQEHEFICSVCQSKSYMESERLVQRDSSQEPPLRMVRCLGCLQEFLLPGILRI